MKRTNSEENNILNENQKKVAEENGEEAESVRFSLSQSHLYLGKFLR